MDKDISLFLGPQIMPFLAGVPLGRTVSKDSTALVGIVICSVERENYCLGEEIEVFSTDQNGPY